MKKIVLCGSLVLNAATTLTGCAWTTLKGTDSPLAYQSTRLQYGVLTNDKDILKQNYKMQTAPGITERVLAGATLPLSAAVETAFLPVTFAITTYLNEFYLDKYTPHPHDGAAQKPAQ
jgi:uncharacterized protein YceK